MTPPPHLPWYRTLYIQVLIAVLIGILIGVMDPALGKALKPFGDGFIKLIKMLIAPIIFCSVVHGIASISDMKKLGRIGLKTLLYFEVVSTVALILGLVVVTVLQPGSGFHLTPSGTDAAVTKTYTQQAHSLSIQEFFLKIIPETILGAFTGGDLLQVLLVSVLSAIAISRMGPRGAPLLSALDTVSDLLFEILQIVVKAAPIGAAGAMAFTVGSQGLGSLKGLLALMASFYLAAGAFVCIVLGLIARSAGFSIFRFLIYIKDELFLVVGTSSSETALPGLMTKLRRLGCSSSTTGLVVPAGYSFNLDGTNIYMTMAIIFLAQATKTHLTLGQEIRILIVAMLSSKGASGVTGAGFIALAATLEIVPAVPIESLALLLGIDRFMSECRALTNLIGNGVATIVISRWENEVTPEQLQSRLSLQPRMAVAAQA